MLPKQTPTRLRAVLAPKASGPQHVLTAAAAAPLDSVALFSSIASLLGNAGQTNYAAANGVLDAAAQLHQDQVGILLGGPHRSSTGLLLCNQQGNGCCCATLGERAPQQQLGNLQLLCCLRLAKSLGMGEHGSAAAGHAAMARWGSSG